METPNKPILLVIQDTLPISLTPELEQYRRDLEREGWSVDTIYVPARQTKPPYTAHFDTAERVWNWLRFANSFPDTKLPHIVLIGAVPVPNTGVRYTLTEMSIDAGCHQCSAYYALPEMEWTDLADNRHWRTAAGKPYLASHRINTPDDGNFDEEFIPEGILVRAAVGVIDFSSFNPKAWGEPTQSFQFQTSLYRRYFERLHSYRMGGQKFSARVAQGDFKPPAGAGFREWAYSVLDAGYYAEFGPTRDVVDLIRRCAPFGIFQDLKLLSHSESVWRELTHDRTKLFAVLSLSFGSGQATADRPRIANAFAAGSLCASSSICNWNLTPLFEGRTVGECWANTLHNNRRALHLVLRGCPAVTLKF